MYNGFSICSFSGFYSSVAEDSVLGYDMAMMCNQMLTQQCWVIRYDTAMLVNQMLTFWGNSVVELSFEDQDALLFWNLGIW